jgi:hypothetical protein
MASCIVLVLVLVHQLKHAAAASSIQHSAIS